MTTDHDDRALPDRSGNTSETPTISALAYFQLAQTADRILGSSELITLTAQALIRMAECSREVLARIEGDPSLCQLPLGLQHDVRALAMGDTGAVMLLTLRENLDKARQALQGLRSELLSQTQEAVNDGR